MVLQSFDDITFAKPRGLRGFEHLTDSVGTGAGLQPGTGGVCQSLGAAEGSLSRVHGALVRML